MADTATHGDTVVSPPVIDPDLARRVTNHRPADSDAEAIRTVNEGMSPLDRLLAEMEPPTDETPLLKAVAELPKVSDDETVQAEEPGELQEYRLRWTRALHDQAKTVAAQLGKGWDLKRVIVEAVEMFIQDHEQRRPIR